MIKKTICICLLLLSAVVTPSFTFAIENEHNCDQVSVTYSFDKPLTSEVKIGNNIYDQVVMQGTSSGGNPGEPSLPARGANILLPQKTDVRGITVTMGKKISLGMGYNIVPVGEPVPFSKVQSDFLPGPDERIYNSEASFPGELFTTVGLYGFRGYEILVLSLHPLRYIPSTGELFYYTEMTVSVELIEDDNVNSLFRGLEQDKQEAIRKVDNPRVADTYTIKTGDALEDDYDLLIITTDELKKGFESLKNMHEAIGEFTVIKTLTEIGGSTPEDIREYIKDAYLNRSIEYVLIGGDDDVVPARDLYVEAWPGGDIEYHMPSDIYYACIDGTYNYDGDDKWGEPTDGDNGKDVDLVAEVYVGRACVGNITEVNHFVNKTISYMNIDFDDEYLKDVVLVGEYLGFGGIAEWGGNYLDELINGSSTHGYTTAGIPSDEYNISILYDRDWPGNDWPPFEIIKYISNGILTINHLGHGSPECAMKLCIQDVPSLTNDKYCFVYSQTCSAGHFDGTDCLAEWLHVKTEHGAFAVIMNARYGWGTRDSTDGPSQRFNREFWDAVFGEDISVISEASQDSKEDNLWRVNWACMRWCYYELNLFGDPTLDITPKPKPIIKIGEITGGIFRISTEIKNAGFYNVTDVHVDISVKGGIFDGIDVLDKSNISILKIGDVQDVRTKSRILGFGNVKITVTTSAPYAKPVSKTASGFVLFFYITNIIILPS